MGGGVNKSNITIEGGLLPFVPVTAAYTNDLNLQNVVQGIFYGKFGIMVSKIRRISLIRHLGNLSKGFDPVGTITLFNVDSEYDNDYFKFKLLDSTHMQVTTFGASRGGSKVEVKEIPRGPGYITTFMICDITRDPVNDPDPTTDFIIQYDLSRTNAYESIDPAVIRNSNNSVRVRKLIGGDSMTSSAFLNYLRDTASFYKAHKIVFLKGDAKTQVASYNIDTFSQVYNRPTMWFGTGVNSGKMQLKWNDGTRVSTVPEITASQDYYFLQFHCKWMPITVNDKHAITMYGKNAVSFMFS